MNELKAVPIISDNPKIPQTPDAEDIMFGYKAYAKTIAEVIAAKENKTPLVIGVYGDWGSGKTTLMETIISFLNSSELENAYKQKEEKTFRKIKPIWFQAWKYKNEDEILASLIERILTELKTDSFIQRCKLNFENATQSIPKATKELIKKFTDIDLDTFISELDFKKKHSFYTTFNDFFNRILCSYLNETPLIDIPDEHNDEKAALAIFIDDLDRCPKPKIREVLETVKLFMDKCGCVFIIGAAKAIIEDAIEDVYKKDADRFLDKIVNVTFNLPKIRDKHLIDLLKENNEIQNLEIIEQNFSILSKALQSNPRNIKRFLNDINLKSGILRNMEEDSDIDFKNILIWNIVEYSHKTLYIHMRDNPKDFLILKDEIKNVIDEHGFVLEEKLKTVRATLREFAGDSDIRNIIHSLDINTEEEFQQLIYLNSITESTSKDEIEIKQSKVHFDEMVELPAKKEFIYQEGEKKQLVKPVEIGIFPVANNLYSEFYRDNGYENYEHTNYWTEQGRNWLKSKKIDSPRFWNDSQWNKPDHPVVGVSWYEAVAFCNWMTEKYGKGIYKYRLPTELEWEFAARGEDGRVFPWGHEFDKERCNNNESDLNETSAVTKYSNGISPFKCYDMAGNVWEWTKTDYYTGIEKDDFELNEPPALRGGSWISTGLNCRCAARNYLRPDGRDDVIGFRCSRITL